MKFLKSLIIISLILLLSACNVNNKRSNVKTLEFWTLQLDGFRPYITEITEQFEATHPDIKIKWVDVPFSEGEKRTLAAVMSNAVPDVVNLNPDFSATLASKNALTDISQYADEAELNKYLPSTMDNLTFDKKLFGIPWYLTTSITYYNKELLKKAGLTDKDLPENYFDLKEFSKKVKNNTNSYAIMPTVCEKGNLLKILNKYGAITYENNNLNFNNERTVEILELFKELYQNNLIPKESITQGHREALEQFMSGETAILVSGTNFLNSIKENSKSVYDNLGIYEQLKGDNGKTDFSLMNLIVPKKSKYPKEAVEFALFLTNKENQLKFAKLAPVFPSQIEALNDEYFSANNADIEKEIRYLGAKQLQNSLTPIKIQNNHSALNEIIDTMTQEVLLNKKSAQKAVSDAQKSWNEFK